MAEAITISQPEVTTLEQQYTLIESSAVLQLLNQNPYLIPVLLEAPEKIYQVFQNATLSLRVELDPEILDYTHLVLSILTDLDAREAIERQNRLDQLWWQQVSSKEIWDKLCILVE